jgi:hypothetical protein
LPAGPLRRFLRAFFVPFILFGVLYAMHCRVVRVLDLDPVLTLTGAIGALAVLRDQPLQSHVAGRAEKVRADVSRLERCREDALTAAR